MLTNRPVLVPETSVIRVLSHGPDESVFLTIDGQIGGPLREGDTVVCRSSHYSLLLVRPPRMMFFDVLRAEAQMGRAMKRISLTAWIFIGMAAGVALGIAGAGVREATRAGEQGVPAADPVDHRAAAVRHAGGRHRRRRRHQADGPHRRQGDSLLRDRHHVRALPRTRRGEPGASRRGRAHPADAPPRPRCRRREATLATVLEHTFPASIIDSMARNDVLQIVVFTFLFGAACASIGAKAEPVVKFCAVAGRGDVPLHEVRDVSRADRRRRGDRGDRGDARASACCSAWAS